MTSFLTSLKKTDGVWWNLKALQVLHELLIAHLPVCLLLGCESWWLQCQGAHPAQPHETSQVFLGELRHPCLIQWHHPVPRYLVATRHPIRLCHVHRTRCHRKFPSHKSIWHIISCHPAKICCWIYCENLNAINKSNIEHQNTLSCLDQYCICAEDWDYETVRTIKRSKYISKCRGWRLCNSQDCEAVYRYYGYYVFTLVVVHLVWWWNQAYWNFVINHSPKH